MLFTRAMCRLRASNIGSICLRLVVALLITTVRSFVLVLIMLLEIGVLS